MSSGQWRTVIFIFFRLQYTDWLFVDLQTLNIFLIIKKCLEDNFLGAGLSDIVLHKISVLGLVADLSSAGAGYG